MVMTLTPLAYAFTMRPVLGRVGHALETGGVCGSLSGGCIASRTNRSSAQTIYHTKPLSYVSVFGLSSVRFFESTLTPALGNISDL